MPGHLLNGNNTVSPVDRPITLRGTSSTYLETLLQKWEPNWLYAGQGGLQSAVLCQVGPECLDGGPTLPQEPGEQGLHGFVDLLPALSLQGLLWMVIAKMDQSYNVPCRKWFSETQSDKEQDINDLQGNLCTQNPIGPLTHRLPLRCLCRIC